MFKINNEIPEQCQWRRSGVFIVNFEHIPHLFIVNFEYISHLFLVFLLLNMNK